MNLAQVPPAIFLNGVAQLLQTLTGRHGHLPLVMPDEQCLGQLVVKAQSVDRFLQGHVEILHIQDDLKHRGNNRAATRSSDHQGRLSISQQNSG